MRSNGGTTNGNTSNGNGKKPRDVVAFYSTPVDGAETLAAQFAPANGAVAIGHRTYSNVPFDRAYKEGDVMTAAQAAFLSAQRIRASLGNEDYKTVDEAAAIEIRDIPAQYSLLEDAVDAVVIDMMERHKIATGRRSDRLQHVAKFMTANPSQLLKGLKNKTVGDAVREQIVKLISDRKEVKGGRPTAAGAGTDLSFFEDDSEEAEQTTEQTAA